MKLYQLAFQSNNVFISSMPIIMAVYSIYIQSCNIDLPVIISSSLQFEMNPLLALYLNSQTAKYKMYYNPRSKKLCFRLAYLKRYNFVKLTSSDKFVLVACIFEYPNLLILFKLQDGAYNK